MRLGTSLSLLLALTFGEAFAGIHCERQTDAKLQKACQLRLEAIELSQRLGPKAWDHWTSLAPAIKEPLKDALLNVSWDEASLDQNGVTYITPVFIRDGHEYQQFLAPNDGYGKTEGRMNLVEGPRFDIWIVRHQRVNRSMEGGLAFLAVDKSTSPKKTYLFTGLPKPLERGKLPIIVPYGENCLMCHSNGNRLLRIQKPVNLETAKRIESFNQKMVAYGRMETILATKHFLPPLPPYAYEPLRIRACIDCHGDTSPVRGPLRRLNHNEILFLVNSETAAQGHLVARGTASQIASMPLEGPGLDTEEIRCLKGWLDRKPQKGCTPSGEVESKPSATQTLLVDASQSSLEAQATSTFSSIAVSGFRLSGSLDCNAGTCQGEIQADLRSITTGIKLRDKHLKENYLSVGDSPFATVTLSPFSLPKASGQTALEVPSELRMKGKTHSYAAKLRCSNLGAVTCSLSGYKIRLENHAIVPPSFLGAKVDPEVTVSGTLVFRRPAQARSLASESQPREAAAR
jgi:hypothetical protein